MGTPKDGLVKVREKLSPPGAWCQWTFARDMAGASVPSIDPDACSWCLMGAISAVGERWDDANGPLDSISGALGMTVTKWNDTKGRTQEEVLKMLDDLIQKQP